ncbi:MAG: hypothetical protein KKE05_05315 [Nanoarchaeota archaeon]|nr:hypothetical protein [Nanoarchaeota archaeon]
MTNLTLYNSFKGQMQTGDCLLWQSRSIIGWLIRFFSKADVNHAGLIIRPSEHGDLKNRRFTLEALEKGIILRLLSERLRSYEGRVWLYPLKDDFNDYRGDIAAWAIEKEGTPYDYKSLFRQIAGRVSADAKELFCSEFCFMAWKEVGIPIEDQKAPRPGDIPGLGIFKDPILIYDDSGGE